MQQVLAEENEEDSDYSTVPIVCITIPLRLMIQQNNWDCGISCIAMVLSDDKLAYFNKHKEDIITEEGIEFNTWTIDLAYLLKKFDLKFKYYTSTIGICPIYYQHRYYNSLLPNDETRVNKKFENAKRNGISIVVKILHISKLIHHLSDCGPIIVLTNANLLTCDVCNKKGDSVSSVTLPYQGHYVVIVGYSFLTNDILYKNPSGNHDVCRMSFTQFDSARHSFGTDDDVILIF